MKPPLFDYRAPATASEALALLARHGYDAKVLAGGQSLVPLLNFRLARPAVIVDINAVEGLDRIVDDEAAKEISIGALVRQTDAERSDIVVRRCPLLVEALRHVGHRAIRNRGTVGGSLAHADPSAELPLVLRALDGRVRVASARGERWIAAADLFVTYLQTALAPDELLVEARFPWTGPGERWSFVELSRRSGDFALAAVCVVLRMGPSGPAAA
ncbi:MAG: xanthine dehydrogenase family protein subunit M, partial [Chloroflexi bacterium]|nr:xanthine dehydrogenase family protein subunit M [Chloroflexota bacterium]